MTLNLNPCSSTIRGTVCAQSLGNKNLLPKRDSFASVQKPSPASPPPQPGSALTKKSHQKPEEKKDKNKCEVQPF